MSIETAYQIESSSSKTTLEVGEQFGQRCKGGEFFLLTSDLGGGKTTFTKGLAQGLGSADVVSSPTFTVNNIYDCRDGLRVYHYDFYRLNDSGMVGYELQEALDDPNSVIVVEWGDVIGGILPESRVDVSIERTVEAEDRRVLNVNVPSSLSYLRGEDL
ncbi:tRNA (adenosine(37)-N6)-threonylcarbamoyltransferase complex ATPase subunit type 1 TsaE [Candidatus Saccharibacteria bacterium]|nr:tRNA (adenosine(37)-N6)-threonylcarbamoyltransferase complex ATPase subunit type 1 TsaE [Candidatus Saccharibacteria bacterium]